MKTVKMFRFFSNDRGRKRDRGRDNKKCDLSKKEKKTFVSYKI